MGWAYGRSAKMERRVVAAFARGLPAVGQPGKAGGPRVEPRCFVPVGRPLDEALNYYERARDESLKIGSTVDAELARINIAEILTDRGELAEAEALLLESLPRWRASAYRYFIGGCLSLLGRVMLRAGRFDESLTRLEDAKAHFLQVGAEQEVLDVDAQIAECRVFMKNYDAALELANDALRPAGPSKAVAKVVPLLERVRAHALLQQGDHAGARAALERSLAAGRTRDDPFEVTLTLLLLLELNRMEGIEPPPGVVAESQALLARLRVRTVPAIPFAAR